MSTFWIVVFAIVYVVGMILFIRNEEDIRPVNEDDILEIIVAGILYAFWPLSWAIRQLIK